MSARMSNRASHASAALSVGLMAVFAGIQSFAETAAPDPAAAPVPLVPTTPEIFSPPPPERGPAPTYSSADTPARVSPSKPSSVPGSGSAPATATASDDDIRDIRGPKSIFPLWQLLAWIAVGVLVALAGFTLWRRLRRPAPPRRLELFEIALQRLEDIRSLMHPSTVREFSIAISDVVRQYIESQMKITATHRTTEEFLRDLLDSSNAALTAHRNLLAEFLQACDMAKFAGVGLSMRIMESLHLSARSFVIETSKPVAAPHPAPGPRHVPAPQT
jgi:Domain of unknown function (DUF4381)